MLSDKSKERIHQLEAHVSQLNAALAESRRYADKLVEHIPYLPADIDNLRTSNAQFHKENEQLKKDIIELSALLDSALDAARQFSLSDEFPGPYTLARVEFDYNIYTKSGDIIAATRYSDFALFILNTLNSVDKRLLVD